MAASAPASTAPEPAPVAVVTGGSSGIGQAVAVTLARRGYRLAVVGRTPVRLEQTLGLLASASRSAPGGAPAHLALNLDVNDEGDMQSMAARMVEHFGRIAFHAALHAPPVLPAQPSGPKPSLFAKSAALQLTYLRPATILWPISRRSGR